MARLSRRQEDGGYYIRTGKGYFGTKQVHPDAIRFLNKRRVYKGDEIPSSLMSQLESHKGWLFTKEEHPFVTFFEFGDPRFGEKPTSSPVAYRGKAQVVTVTSQPTERQKPRQKRAAKDAPSQREVKPAARQTRGDARVKPTPHHPVNVDKLIVSKEFCPTDQGVAYPDQESVVRPIEVYLSGKGQKISTDCVPWWLIILILGVVFVLGLIVSFLSR
ncbi:MAG: hypothetical protein KC435_07815 [Thermomicrobiales bacterium]|nr:hypothetical protein [Thermomicrobiales bacterium]